MLVTSRSFIPITKGTHHFPWRHGATPHLVPSLGGGREGTLAINYRKLTCSAGKPLAPTHQIHGKTNTSLSHSNMTCLRNLYKRVLSSMPFKTWPTLLPLPSFPVAAAVSITFSGCEHLLCKIFSNQRQMAVQRNDKSWHFPFLIRRFLCKQPSLFFRAHTSNGQFLFFFPPFKLNGCKQKGGNGRKICQSFTAERCLTKEALKTWQLFFSMSVLDTVGSLTRGRGRQQTTARGLTPILTSYRWHGTNTGSKRAIDRVARRKFHSRLEAYSQRSFRQTQRQRSAHKECSNMLKRKSPWTH